MNRAIILTYAPVTEEERELLVNTKIFKLAVNQHAEYLKPDMRICGDFNLTYMLTHFPERIISMRDRLRYYSKRVIQSHGLEFKGATILGAIDWLIGKGYNEILIVGDNTVNTTEFQNNVNKHIFDTTLLYPSVRMFAYKRGNFFLPVMSVKDFIGEQDEK